MSCRETCSVVRGRMINVIIGPVSDKNDDLVRRKTKNDKNPPPSSSACRVYRITEKMCSRSLSEFFEFSSRPLDDPLAVFATDFIYLSIIRIYIQSTMVVNIHRTGNVRFFCLTFASNDGTLSEENRSPTWPVGGVLDKTRNREQRPLLPLLFRRLS